MWSLRWDQLLLLLLLLDLTLLRSLHANLCSVNPLLSFVSVINSFGLELPRYSRYSIWPAALLCSSPDSILFVPGNHL
jgi:hypothetical protein